MVVGLNISMFFGRHIKNTQCFFAAAVSSWFNLIWVIDPISCSSSFLAERLEMGGAILQK
jgi:hypothetical protein